ncbi:MAG: aldose 1-epimerase family protein [Oscillospiraceae bacterium]|nr:aldose 1-epimerase family protein [Oscillospiraceae bacterium]
MLYELKKGNLKLTADSFGAELHSIQFNKLEYLWQCGDAWKRYAPILFPFICSPENRTYQANGKEYHMKANHGFARDLEFNLLEQTENSITFQLDSNPETLAQYPYQFQFKIKYTILDNGVKIEHTVINTDNKPIYFYIGGHPAFNCPLEPNENFTDYIVEYETEETVTRMIHNQPVVLLENEKILHMTRELFDYDAIILANPKSKKISLKSKNSCHAVTVEFPESECIAVWSPMHDDRAKFVCLEPWTSVPTNYDDSELDIEKKAHAIQLDANQKYHYSYSIKIK